MKLTHLLAIVLAWRLVLSGVAWIAPQITPYTPSFPYTDTILSPWGPKALYSWGNFDGVHYLTIIAKGYVGTGAIQAFFPLYPVLVKIVSQIFINPIISGILVSTASLIGALYYLSKLMRIDHSKVITRRTLWLMLLFPTAFFFTAVYTESLFLLFSVASLYYMRQKQFGKSALLVLLASATRLTGILLVPALLLEIFIDHRSRKKSQITVLISKLVGYGTLASGGLIGYMVYLKHVFGDPLLFLHVQSLFGAGRQTDQLILLPRVFWRYIKMILTVDPQSLAYFTVVSEGFVAIVFLILAVYAFKHVRLSYAVYALLSYLVPTLTGTFTSLPRYVLVLFPLFIVLAKIIPRRIFQVIISFSGILLIINTILFIQGYWVS